MTERLWFKIGEAAQLIGVTPKELRYWERVIPEIEPRRSRGNLRYYHRDELPRLGQIREWLAEGFTVADCQALLKTGHLARSLDLGLETVEECEPKAHRKGRKTTKTSGGAAALSSEGLEPILKALRALYARLSRPVGAASRRKETLT